MPPQEFSDAKLLDYTYGLLDASESAAVAAHLAASPDSANNAARLGGLFQRAAVGTFPGVRFDPSQTPKPMVEPKSATPGRTMQSTWVKWTVAATVLLAVAALGGPSLVDALGYARYRQPVDRELAQLQDLDAQRTKLRDDIAKKKKAAADRVNDGKQKQTELETMWIAAEAEALKKASERPFQVQLSGPGTAIPGAPNEYRIRVTDGGGKAQPATIEATVKDSNGTSLFTKTFHPEKNPDGNVLKLPAGIWSNAKAESDVYLHVSVVDSKTGLRSDLTENLRMLEPVYTTFLTTDKPMYRPGEVVFFRSLTLDRSKFLPPTQETTLRFEILAPSGQVLPGSETYGLAKPATLNPAGQLTPVIGPDGQPIRGVGTGAFALTPDLAGGEYILKVWDATAPVEGRKSPTKPLAIRKFLVNKYTPDRLLKKLEFDGKSYGPGDKVAAKFDLKDQAQALGGAELTIEVMVDGELVKLSTNPAKTDADGTASLQFTLPKKDEIKDARVSITASAKGITETLTRKVPLTTRKLNVEFFPEGGDLVVGVPNRVYFRATTTFGKPADIRGVLTDGTKDIASIATLTDADHPGANQGFGRFEFTPVAGQKYAVRLDKPTSVIQPKDGYALPASQAAGVVLQVTQGVLKPDAPIGVKLWSVGGDRTVLVGAYSRGRPVAHTTVKLEAGKATDATLAVTDAKLGGVTRITVFDLPNGEAVGRDDLKPLAERLIYREPGEALKLSYAAKKPGTGSPMKTFTPGSRVELELTSTDETDAPKAAILWTAVVNESVITMADEKTERLLPTHFLLSGEVQKGDELEHADFLLTKHPRAGEALDLLLGTQGWRRFAEQAPSEFRKTVPAEDAEKLLLVAATDGPIPTGWRTSVRKVFDEYWPKYEASLLELEAAERDQFAMLNTGNPEADLQKADQLYVGKLNDFGKQAVELEAYDNSLQQRRNAILLYLIPIIGLAGAFFTTRTVAFRSGAPERRTLGWASLAMLLLAGFLGGVAAWTGRDNDAWRSMAKVAPKPERHAWYQSVDKQNQMATAAAMPMAADEQNGFLNPLEVQPREAKKEMNADARPGDKAMQVPGFAPPNAPGGVGGAPQPFAPMMMLPQAGGPGRGAGGLRAPMANGGVVFQQENAKGEFEVGDPLGFKRDSIGARSNRGAQLPPTANERFGNFLQKRNIGLADGKQKAQNQYAIGMMDSMIPRVPSLLVREYAHTREANVNEEDATRTDFTETLLWQPVLVTPASGKATVEFTLGDAINPYRVLVAGHTLDGRIGAITGTIEVRKSFSLDPKLPVEIGSSDKLDVVLLGANNTDGSLEGKITVLPKGLKILGSELVTVELPANGGGRKVVRLAPDKLDGPLSLKLEGKAGAYRDSVERNFTVVADGFPAAGSHSDVLETSVGTKLKLPEMLVPGTLQLRVAVYPNTLSEVQAGLEGLLREPYGCFEQTSTSNYPNVLVLDYLNETNQAKPDVSKRAKDLLDKGYAKLTSFECAVPSEPGRKGYEWFGGTAPPHEALTAYGLLQFTDMARVHPVDAAMVKRTKDYLLSRRDGQGGFERNARALDSFGYAPQEVTNAYIVWALTESERKDAVKSDLSKEIDAILALAKNGPFSKDSYYLGLAANSLINSGKKAEGIAILKTLAKAQAKDGSVPGAATSITKSSGQALLIETTGLAMLGWIKVNETGEFRINLDASSKWLGSQKNGFGAYGSTQSTILTLKALIEYARTQKRSTESGEIRVVIDGAVVARKNFSTESVGPIAIEVPDAEKYHAKGIVDIRVETDAKQSYPCTFSWEARARKPQSSAECQLTMTTALDKAAVAEGETLRLSAKITNKADKEQGMVTAIIGIPAGLKIPEDLKQLKALTERPEGGKETVSYFEIRGRELVLYWRGMAPKQTVDVAIDLIADFPGEFRGPASRVYLYYGAEHKQWVDPVDIKVIAK